MICCNSAFEQGHLDLWRYINAFIIIITQYVSKLFSILIMSLTVSNPLFHLCSVQRRSNNCHCSIDTDSSRKMCGTLQNWSRCCTSILNISTTDSYTIDNEQITDVKI